MDDFAQPEAYLASLRAEADHTDVGARLGRVVAGSLSSGLEVRLDHDRRLEDLAVGRYVVMKAGGRLFFGMITDIALDSTHPAFEKTPPDLDNDFLRQVYLGTSAFGRLHVSPLLELDEDNRIPRPVKTIPGHYTPVATATPEEVAYVFGAEGVHRDPNGRTVHYFHIGRPLEMEDVKITLSLERLVERSSAVFGKSGTGKTFLSRLLLAGIIQSDVAVNLIFDMHNEYGWMGSSEGATRTVKGLKQLFPGRVTIFTLDPESSRRRQSHPDATVTIPADRIEPEDLEMLAGVLDLSEAQVGAMYVMRRRLGPEWLGNFMNDDWVDAYESEVSETIGSGLRALAEDLGLHQSTLAALRRKLDRYWRYEFITTQAGEDSVDRILAYLQEGRSVVLEFGRYGSDLGAYLLVANFLTRRIHQRYVTMKERAFGAGGAEPRPLVVTIEEAHKFLDPQIARHTIFGTIARELRKYNVTLLIVDQRPSGIDPEIMSQVGTRITLALDNEDDIRAVFMGISGGQALREVLARLDSKEQALILGHAVPMPVVVQTRPYDTEFYRQMGYADEEELEARFQQNQALMRGRQRNRLT